VVERDLAKVEVASSSLVSRSTFSGMRDEQKGMKMKIHPSAFIPHPFLMAA
jgi:hypothetical protein